jgi:hypothetical protein
MGRTSVINALIGACGLAIVATGYAVSDELKSYQGAPLSFMERASMGSFSVCVHDQGGSPFVRTPRINGPSA